MIPAPQPGPRPARQVLLLEDDPAIIRIVSATLSRAGLGVRSVERLGGLEGALAEGAPDLFVLDVNLPDGDGFEACRRLRALPQTAHIPIIFLTEREQVDYRLRAFQLGAQDYITKPFSPEELAARIQAHLMIKVKRDEKEAQLAGFAMRERLQTDLMDMVIHDLRAPLGTVKMSLGMLAQDGTISAAQHKMLVAMSNDAMDAALLMLNDLLDLRAGNVAVQKAHFGLEAALKRAAAILGPKAANHGMTVTCEVRPPGAQAVSDEKMLLRVILNLLGNAIKYSKKSGPIALSLSLEQGRLRLEVADRGPGVPDTDKERIFEKFQRIAHSEEPGTGIGLAFCRLAAGTLGGRIWVEDNPGGGSRFILEVPAEAVPEGGEAAELLGPEVMKEYLDDCTAQLCALEASLPAGNPVDPEFLESVRLAAHRLAGSAGTYGYPGASAVAASLEHRVLDSKGKELSPDTEEIRLAIRKLRRELGLPG